jgi:hypothetical protein
VVVLVGVLVEVEAVEAVEAVVVSVVVGVPLVVVGKEYIICSSMENHEPRPATPQGVVKGPRTKQIDAKQK